MSSDTGNLLAYTHGDAKSYLTAREGMIRAEQGWRLDASAIEGASDLEKQACDALDKLRSEEWEAFSKAHAIDAKRSPSILSRGLSHPRRHLVQKTGDVQEVEQPNDLSSSPVSALRTKRTKLSDLQLCLNDNGSLVMDSKQDEFLLFGHPKMEEVFRGMGVYGAMRAGLLSDKSKLYQLFKVAPKGGDLHCHFEGSADANLYLHFAAKTAELYLHADRPLHTSAELYQAHIDFQVVHPDKWGSQGYIKSETSIWSEDYVPLTWVRVSSARDEFPHPDTYDPPVITSHYRALDQLQHTPQPGESSPKQHAFDTWLHSRLTMTPHAFVADRRTSVSAWAHFSSTFLIIRGLINYAPNFKQAAKHVMWNHISDGVPYMEVRVNFLPKTILAEDMKTQLPHTEWCRIWVEAEAEVREEVAMINNAAPETFIEPLHFHAAKMIFTSIRFIDGDALKDSMLECIKCKEAYPDLIVGFDLVGHEDPGVTLREYLPQLLWFTEQVKQRGWFDPEQPAAFDALGERSLPFLFHAGETLDAGGPADDNLYDAILLGTRRLGHACSLRHHPLLMDLVKQKGIMVESCPISNEVLRFTDTLASHPLVDYVAHGVPLALASDDCTQFGNMGLTPDLFFTFMSIGNVSLITIREFTRQSILHARMRPETKTQLLAQLDARWERFWNLVVDTSSVET